MTDHNAASAKHLKDGYVVMDSTLADIIAKRSTPVPSLEFLKYGDATSYGQTYSYSEDMLAAVGGAKKDKTKGTLGKSSFADGGAPWASAPKELEEPIASIYGSDFQKKAPPVPLEGEPISATEIMKVRKREIAKKREQARELQDQLRQQQREEEKKKRFVPKEKSAVVKVFSHAGVMRRCVSAPPDVDDDAISPIAHSKKTIPMETRVTTMGNPLTGGETGLSLRGTEGQTLKQLYPYQRQRMKFEMLEHQRENVGKRDLLGSGWADSTEPGGKDKHCTNPALQTHLCKEDRDRVEEEFQRVKAHETRKKELRKARETPAPIPQQGEGRQSVSSLSRHSATPPFSTDETPTNATPKPASFKPISATFRPELPGAVANDTMPPPPPETDSTIFGAPPPWGRQTSQDDKWQEIRVFKPRSKTKVYEPIQKIEIDRELRVIRDQGLMKRERRQLLKTMDTRQIEYIKSLPANFGKEPRQQAPKSKAAKPMKPAASIAAAYLK